MKTSPRTTAGPGVADPAQFLVHYRRGRPIAPAQLPSGGAGAAHPNGGGQS